MTQNDITNFVKRKYWNSLGSIIVNAIIRRNVIFASQKIGTAFYQFSMQTDANTSHIRGSGSLQSTNLSIMSNMTCSTIPLEQNIRV